MPGQNIDFLRDTPDSLEEALVASCVVGVVHDASVRWIDCAHFIQSEMPVSRLITTHRVTSAQDAIGALLSAVRFEQDDLIVVSGLRLEDERDGSLWLGCFEVLRRHKHPRIIIISDCLANWKEIVSPFA